MSGPLEYGCSPERGRHFLAARNIKVKIRSFELDNRLTYQKGEEVIRVAPAAAALREEYLHDYCSGCFRPLALIPSTNKV